LLFDTQNKEGSVMKRFLITLTISVFLIASLSIIGCSEKKAEQKVEEEIEETVTEVADSAEVIMEDTTVVAE